MVIGSYILGFGGILWLGAHIPKRWRAYPVLLYILLHALTNVLTYLNCPEGTTNYAFLYLVAVSSTGVCAGIAAELVIGKKRRRVIPSMWIVLLWITGLALSILELKIQADSYLSVLAPLYVVSVAVTLLLHRMLAREVMR